MPICEYEHDSGECELGRRFEQLQRVSDPPFEQCPRCGRPCHRVVSAFSAGKSEGGLLSSSNLERQGFTRYEKSGAGTYEKTAGKGPDVISKES